MDKITLTNEKKSYTLDKKDVFRSIYLEGLINYEIDAKNNEIDEIMLEDVNNKELKILVQILKYKKRTIKKRYAKFLADYHIKYPDEIANNPSISYTNHFTFMINENKKLVVTDPIEKHYIEYVYKFSKLHDLIASISLYFDTSAPKYDCIKSIRLHHGYFDLLLFDEKSFKLMKLNNLIKINKVLSYFENGKLMHRYKFDIPFWFSKNGPEHLDLTELEMLIHNVRSHNIKYHQRVLDNYIDKHYSNYLYISKLWHEMELYIKADNIKNLCLEKQCYIINADIRDIFIIHTFNAISPRFEYKKIDVDNNCAKLIVNHFHTKFYIQYEFKNIEVYMGDVKSIDVSYSQLLNNSDTLIPLLHIPFSTHHSKYGDYEILINFEKKIEYIEILCVIEDVLVISCDIGNKYYAH